MCRAIALVSLILMNIVPGESPEHIKLPQGLSERVKDFELAFKEKRYRKAIEQLEMIPQGYPGQVLPVHPGSPLYLPVSLSVLHSLSRMPPEIVEEHRLRSDSKAAELLNQYHKENDRQHLEQILNQFPLSSASVDALRILAELHFEAGESLTAGFTWHHLLKLYSKEKDHALTASLLAFVKVLNGRNIEVTQYLKELDGNKGGEGKENRKINQLIERLRKVQTSSLASEQNIVAALPTRRINHSNEPSNLPPSLEKASLPALSRLLKVVRQGTSLTAYDKSGKTVWDTTQAAIGTENEELLKSLRFMSKPVATENSFVATGVRVAGELQALVISFDSKTGIIQWQKTIALSADDTYLGMGRLPGQPVYQQGLLFVNTNFGIIAAIKGSTGQFFWMCKYPQYKTNILSRSIRFEEAWDYQTPRFSFGYLLISPQDAPFLFVVDTLTGQIKSKIKRGSYRNVSLVLNNFLTLDGADGVACLNLKTAKIDWKREHAKDIKPVQYGGPLRHINDGYYSIYDGEFLRCRKQADPEFRATGDKHRIENVPAPEIRIPNTLRLTDDRDRLARIQAEINAPGLLNDKPSALHKQDNVAVSDLVRTTLPTYREHSFAKANSGAAERTSKLLMRLGASFRQEYVDYLANEILRGVIPEQAIHALSSSGGFEKGLLSSALKWYESRQWQDESLRQQFLNDLAEHFVRHNAISTLEDEADMPWLKEQLVSRKLSLSKTEALKEWYRKNPVSTAKVEVVSIGEEFIVLALRKVLSGVGSIQFMDYRRFRDLLILDKNTGQEKCSIKLGSGVTLKGDILVAGGNILVMERRKITAYGLGSGDVLWTFPNRSKRGPGSEFKPDEYRGVALCEDRIVALTTEGKVISVSMVKGNLLWSVDLKQNSLLWLGDADGKAVLMDKRSMNFVVVNCSDGSVELRSDYAPNDKMVFGKALLLNDSIIAYARFQVAQGGGSNSLGTIVSYSTETGLENWRFSAEYRVADLRSLSSSNVMIVPPTWLRTGVIDVLDTKSGEKVWSYRNAGAKCQVFNPGKGKVYVIASKDLEGVLTCLDIKTGKAKWFRPLANSGGNYSLVEHLNLLCVYTQNLPRAFLFDAATGTSKGEMSFKGRSRLGIGKLGSGLLVFTDREIFKQLIHVTEAGKGKQPRNLNELFWVYGNRARAGDGLGSFYQYMDELRQKGRFPVKGRMLETNLSLTYGNAQHQKKKIRVKKLSREIEVDGEMKDAWPSGARIPLRSLKHISLVENNEKEKVQWRGENDLSGDVFLGWDSKHLYISVDVSDDVSHSFSSDSEVWKGDGLMIAIDPDLDGGFGYNGRDYVFTQALMGKKPDKEDQEGDQGEPEGQYSVRRRLDGTGTVYEAAVPWQYLARIQPAAGSRFGFNLYVTDDDSGHGASKGLVLTPGICLDRRRSLFGRGYSPELFAEVVLEE